jgi:hypothetical protein
MAFRNPGCGVLRGLKIFLENLLLPGLGQGWVHEISIYYLYLLSTRSAEVLGGYTVKNTVVRP